LKTRALALVLLAAAGCESAAQRQGAQVNRTLGALLEGTARAGDRKLDLRGTRLGFDWDRLVVLPPYATANLAQRGLGFAWSEVNKSASQMQDRYQLLVFVRGDEVVAWVDHDIGRGDFGALVDQPPLPNSQALFEVQTDGGWRRIVPAPSR